MLIQAGLMLLDGVITFFAGLLMLRFLMQAWRVSFANPIGNFTMQATNWLVKPLRRVLPGLMGFDLASLLPVLLLKAIYLLAVLAANGGLALFDGGNLAPNIFCINCLSVVAAFTVAETIVPRILSVFSVLSALTDC